VLPITISRQVVFQAISFIIVSTLGVLLVLSVFYDAASPLMRVLWVFYAPAWLISNGLFGGIHGAPAWALIPSIVIAVVGQNALLWFVTRKLIYRFRK
jgi:hypothetical protein